MTKDQKEQIKQLFRNKNHFNNKLLDIIETVFINGDTYHDDYYYYMKEYETIMEMANENLDEIEKLTGKSYERYKPYVWWKENDNE